MILRDWFSQQVRPKTLHHFGNLIQSRLFQNRAFDILQNEAKHFQISGYLVFWIAILAAFAIVGLRGFKTARRSPKADGISPYCGSDGLLHDALGVSGASEKILDALGKMPSRGPVVVFWPANNGNAIISYQIVSYLTWPREVWSVSMDKTRIEKAVADFKNSPFGVMIFCFLKPPSPQPDSKAIGPMTIVPVEQKKQ
jgi:hypothetical protein